jgi:sugar/nucleoside kinase (ribokinase family)
VPPDFLVAGHLTRDEHADGTTTLGGAVTFAAIAARNLGYRVGILTGAADDFPEPDLLREIDIARIPSPTTTTFQNRYSQGKRNQYVRDVAPAITAADLPAGWSKAKIALLGPVADEIDPGMARAFSDVTLLAVSPQGWMRQWDETGRVRSRAWTTAAEILAFADALILSEEDLGDFAGLLSSYVALVPLVVLTRGDEGVTIYRQGEPTLDVPAFPSRAVDPTGAGDSFAAGFLIALYETGDILQAARFGNATASLAIESMGAETMPTRAEVEARLARESSPRK